MIWHQCVCSLWSSHSLYVSHHESHHVFLLLSLISHPSHFIHLLLFSSVHALPSPLSKLAPAWEGRVGAALGAGAGVPGEQADEKDQKDGEWDHLKAADPGTGTLIVVEQPHFSIQCGTTYPWPSVFSYGNSVPCQKFTILNSSHWMLAGKNILVCGWIKPVCFDPLRIFFHALMGGFFCGSAWIHLLLVLTHEYIYIYLLE